MISMIFFSFAAFVIIGWVLYIWWRRKNANNATKPNPESDQK